MATVAEQQLELLHRMAALEPIPCVMGGFAEDALVAGTMLRPHEDVDWICPRSELELRLDQARELGFTDFETWGDAAPGEPFYLYAQNEDLKVDIGVSDELGGEHVVSVHRLYFDVDGREAPAGYRFYLPSDTYEHPPVEIDGVMIRPISPLALYQLRVGFSSQGSFGPVGEKQLASMRRLRETFFADRSEDELAPRIELF